MTQRSSPFPVGNIVTDPRLFHGRQKECTDVVNRLRKMESTSITGPRRIGKSSLAYHILSTGSTLLGNDYVFVWLDGQSNHLTSMDKLFTRVANVAAFPYASKSNGSDALIEFEDRVCAYKRKLVLIINEFETLTDDTHRGEFPRSFYNTLRLLAEQAHCALITTSYTPLKNVCANILEVSSPFYNIFAQIVLTEFLPPEVDEFLQSKHLDFNFTASEQVFIQKRVPDYRHPLILQIASDTLFFNRNARWPLRAILCL